MYSTQCAISITELQNDLKYKTAKKHSTLKLDVPSKCYFDTKNL